MPSNNRESTHLPLTVSLTAEEISHLERISRNEIHNHPLSGMTPAAIVAHLIALDAAKG